MKTFLKNYTSDVPVSVTLGRIESVLIRVGGLPCGCRRIVTQPLTRSGKTTRRNGPKGKKRGKSSAQQAERTAWKLMQDWCEVQLSLIQVKQAEFLEVFLPFVWDGGSNQTFYNRIKGGGYKALLPEKT